MQTYDDILKSMTEKYTECTGVVPDEKSDIGIRLRVLAGEVYSNLVNTEWLKRQMFFATAQGEYLDMHAAERGLKRKAGTRSSGTVTFSVIEAAAEDIAIPKGTIVACVFTLLRFETIEDAVIKKGAVSVNVGVRSINTGKENNVLPSTVTFMVTPPPGVDEVNNAAAFEGGCDTETDESLRERIGRSIMYPANSTNSTYYQSIAESVEGVASAGVVPRGRGLGTVDVYIAADGALADDTTVNKVQQLLTELREVNVDVLVKKADMSYVDIKASIAIKDGYEYTEVKAQCIKAISDFVNSRGVNGEVLMCQVSEILYHTEGVAQFIYDSSSNRDYRKIDGKFPVAKTISISRLIV